MRLRLLLLAGTVLAFFGGATSAQAATYPTAVVLVSGFNTTSPFTTPDPACNGQEGQVWGVPTGPAAALKTAGFSVFTAPVRHLNNAPASPCPATGEPLPPPSEYIDSGGDIEANGAALARFLAFLRDNYGVTRVHLVGHSDGGNWSRSAIGQSGLFPGVDVASLTTLGTPYTGSFLADLAIELHGGGCDFSDPTEQALCKLALDLVGDVIDDQGEVATQQLTHSFLAEWNGRQTMAACPVTTIAGTYFNLPLLKLPYYDPADGYVGRASAFAQAARSFTSQRIPAPNIPNLRIGGSYPVVHAESLHVIDPNNLLNQTAISADVAAIVQGIPPNLPACNALTAASAAGADATAKKKGGALKLRLPMRLMDFPTKGRLRAPGSGDVLVAMKGARLRCGKRGLTTTPLLGDPKGRLALGAQCRRPVGVKGGEALLYRTHPRLESVVTVRGRKIRVLLAGVGKAPHTTMTVGGKTKALKLDAKGRSMLPARTRDAVLRVTVPTGLGPATGSAVIAGR